MAFNKWNELDDKKKKVAIGVGAAVVAVAAGTGITVQIGRASCGGIG